MTHGNKWQIIIVFILIVHLVRILLIATISIMREHHTWYYFQEFGDSARAKRLYAEDSDDEEEIDSSPNPKLGAGNSYSCKGKSM